MKKIFEEEYGAKDPKNISGYRDQCKDWSIPSMLTKESLVQQGGYGSGK